MPCAGPWLERERWVFQSPRGACACTGGPGFGRRRRETVGVRVRESESRVGLGYRTRRAWIRTLEQRGARGPSRRLASRTGGRV